ARRGRRYDPAHARRKAVSNVFPQAAHRCPMSGGSRAPVDFAAARDSLGVPDNWLLDKHNANHAGRAAVIPDRQEGEMKNHVKGAVIAAAVAGLFMAKGTFAQGEKPKEGAKVKCEGVNQCKGQGACAGGGHDCAGKNGCKGKGWVEMSSADDCK